MIKTFISNEYGQEDQFWEKMWQDVRLDDYERRCGHGSLGFLLDEYLPRDGRILEGGCGPGHWVMYYRKKGYDIIGVDYAQKTIDRLHDMFGDIPVYKGDVTRLDFPNDHFDACYSGGVVEHFEEGPEEALREAHRVLKPGGRLLITVPYVNLSRQMVADRHIRISQKKFTRIAPRLDGRKAIWSLCSKPGISLSPVCDYHFHEYILTISEFRGYLEESGFSVESVIPFSVKYGLRDYEIYRKIQQNRIKRQAVSNFDMSSQNRQITSKGTGNKIKAVAGLFWQTVTDIEKSNNMFSSLIIKIMKSTFANLVMFVAKK